jgi:AraC-like DNA-binding protein
MQDNHGPAMTIVKTRHGSEAGTGGSRGILRLPHEGVQVCRRTPSPPLQAFVAYYWKVSWDLRDSPPHLQETLPHPNVYLVFDNGRLQLSGVSTTKFTRTLAGEGFACGVKFRPGGFRPFLQASVSSLTDRIVEPCSVFGSDAEGLEMALLSSGEEEIMFNSMDTFLLQRVPPLDENIELAESMVRTVLEEPAIRTVDDLVNRMGIGKRSLQRLFREYVGVPPKWVIQRYRLHELISRLETGERLNWPDLALELGYHDQAHLIHDFRSITGHSPAGYQQR